MKANRTSLYRTLLAAMLLVAVAGCARKHAADNTQLAPPVTKWEQINLTNAELAIANDGVAKGLIAASNLGALEDEYTAQVTAVQFQVAAWQKELTPLLKNSATAQSNAELVKKLTTQISGAASALINSGNAGIKNKGNAAQLQQGLTSLQTTVSNLTDLLAQVGILKN